MDKTTDNPFDALAAGLLATLLAVGVAGAKIAAYGGQDPDEIRERVRQWGPTVMVRAVGGKAAQPDGPLSADCADVQVQIVAAARPTAQRSAWSYAWTAYAALRNSTAGVEWLREDLQFRQAQIEDETPDCLIVSLTLAAHADLGEWNA